MGVTARTVVSPDGRTWQVTKVRERLSLDERRREPFFWSGILATIVIVGAVLRLVITDPLSPWILVGAVIPLTVIWILERGTFMFRPRIQAQTTGPPRERVVWKTGHPLDTRRLMRRAIKAIEIGRPVNDQPGLSLVQWDSGEKSS
jgi:hypothetical protein